MNIEMHNKLTFRPSFTELTLILVGKMRVLTTVLLILQLTLDIKKHRTPLSFAFL